MKHGIAEGLANLATPCADLNPDPANARRHDEKNIATIQASYARFGQRKPLVVQRQGMIVRAGNGSLEAAKRLGWTHVAALVLDESQVEAVAFSIADNRSAELATWDDDALAQTLKAIEDEGGRAIELGWDVADLNRLLRSVTGSGVRGDVDDVPDAAQVAARVRPGEMWALGRHRLLCGDATDPATSERLLAGRKADAVLTDPPYCSGGFQDAGRSKGSKGTDAAGYKPGDVRNDTLSARGYQSMLRGAVAAFDARAVYVFTDWRMWVYLFDLVEALGYGVRNMLVWDKGSPGMGVGWRAQHELVLFGTRESQLWGAHATKGCGAWGNVLQAKRTGNKHHATEKPVDLLRQVVACSTWAAIVADPFLGSGSTLLACELEGRDGVGCELDPRICDVALLRWERLTGGKAERVEA